MKPLRHTFELKVPATTGVSQAGLNQGAEKRRQSKKPPSGIPECRDRQQERLSGTSLLSVSSSRSPQRRWTERASRLRDPCGLPRGRGALSTREPRPALRVHAARSTPSSLSRAPAQGIPQRERFLKLPQLSSLRLSYLPPRRPGLFLEQPAIGR